MSATNEAVMYPLTALIDPHFIVYLEFVGDMTFVSVEVLRWQKSTRRRFLRAWNEFAERQSDLYSMPLNTSRQVPKFAEMMGFEYLQDHHCTDRKVRELYIRRSTL